MEQTLKSSSVWTRLVFSVILLVAAVAVFLNRQLMIDSFLAWQYQPTPQITAIAARDKLTEKGRFYLYASQPQLNDRQAFNKACTTKNSEQSVVLGCYTGMKIHVFDVYNPKLDGIKEVTAAHEMLHAAYDRLSTDERKRVDDLVAAQLNKISDTRILDLIKEYDKTEPGERLNEMHSILGTEVAQLNPELETYYQQYFQDRGAVVGLAANYSAVFEDLKNRMDTLVSELTSLADRIESENARYKSSAQQLNSDIESFNARARSGQMTRAEFDAQRAALETRQQSLQSSYDSIKADIATYDRKRSELEAINTESDVLNRSIDSKLSPVPSI